MILEMLPVAAATIDGKRRSSSLDEQRGGNECKMPLIDFHMQKTF